MKCSKCGTMLEEGSNICPNCQNVMSYDDYEEIEELDDTAIINENMSPPVLDLNEVIETNNVVDINSSSNEELYESDPTIKESEIQEEDTFTPSGKVDIAIPSVSEVVENADAVTGVVSEGDKEEQKNKSKFKFDFKGNVPALYLVIASIATLIVGMLLGKSLFSTGYITSSCDASSINTKVVANGKNNETYLNGMKYKIPTAYLYDKRDNGLLIYDKSGNIRMFLRLENGSYDNIASSKTSIKESLKIKNILVNSIEEKKLSTDGKSFVILELTTTDGKNRIVAFKKYNADKLFYMEILDTTNNYNSKALEVLDDIIVNASEENGATIESIDLFDVSKLLINAANEYNALISNKK